MPIVCQQELKPLNRDEFGKLSYQAFADVLAIRRELGRFFDEKHYKKALALRRSDIQLEVPILVSHGSFKKFYFLDVLLALGGVLEFKATAGIIARHKAQLMHYLMLAELWHGMLINVRPEQVTQEFVNNVMTHQDRIQFKIDTEQWLLGMAGAAKFQQVLTELLRDWGTCLDLSLYEEGITYFFGGESAVIRPAAVSLDHHDLGLQTLRFVAEKTAFKLTALENIESQRLYATHLQRLANHTDIEGLLWANIARHKVTFRCLTPELTETKGQKK